MGFNCALDLESLAMAETGLPLAVVDLPEEAGLQVAKGYVLDSDGNFIVDSNGNRIVWR